MKGSTQGNTNSLKSKGEVFPPALGFLTQIKTLLCWAKSWAKPYKKTLQNSHYSCKLLCAPVPARLSCLTSSPTLNFPPVIPVLFPLLPEALGSWTLLLFIFKWVSSSQTSKGNFKMQMAEDTNYWRQIKEKTHQIYDFYKTPQYFGAPLVIFTVSGCCCASKLDFEMRKGGNTAGRKSRWSVCF